MLSLSRIAPHRKRSVMPEDTPKVGVVAGPQGRTLRRQNTDWKEESYAERAVRFMKSDQTKQEAKNVFKAALLLVLYLALAILVYGQLEPEWSAIDRCYFAMMSMSTVGYGDISPSPNASSRGFTLFMIFFGIIAVFTRVANAIAFCTHPPSAWGRRMMEKAFPQIGVDLDGDGGVDYYKPRPAPIYYAKNLFPSILLNLALQVISALVFTALDDTWTFGDAIYHCLVVSEPL